MDNPKVKKVASGAISLNRPSAVKVIEEESAKTGHPKAQIVADWVLAYWEILRERARKV